MAQASYEYLLGIGHYFVDGAPELLQALKDKYELYIVSNGTASVQDSRLESAGIAPYFKDIFISERLGADKPTKKFFDIVFSRIEGFERDKAVIVGDRLSSDILGGINAGIKTCWFNPKRLPGKENIPADYEIHALSELPELLEKSEAKLTSDFSLIIIISPMSSVFAQQPMRYSPWEAHENEHPSAPLTTEKLRTSPSRRSAHLM